MKLAELLKQHGKEIEAIVEAHGASNPRVFGSVRYGIDTPESDIDLLVDRHSAPPGFTYFNLSAALEDLLGVPVDVLTPDELPQQIRGRVLQEARDIADGDYGFGGTPEMHDKSRRLPLYIGDILKEIAYVERVVPGRSFDDFLEDETLQRALIRSIEVIGEAARSIRQHAPEFTEAHPELPLGMANLTRNHLIHRYFAVDLEIIWEIVTVDLPALKEMLEAIAPPASPE